MKILHIGDIAGVPQYLAMGQRELGHESRNMSFYRTGAGRSLDYYIDMGHEKLEAIVNRFYFLKFINKFDIFHFHFRSLVPNGMDIPFWKFLGKTVIIHYHGTDVRWLGESYFYRKCADYAFVCTPDLITWVPSAEWLPNPINIKDLPNVGQVNDIPVVVHSAPFVESRREIKGTKHVLRAVEQVKKDGYEFEFRLVRNMLFKDAMEAYKKADIVIAGVNPLYGACSMVTIESMALGKPVITCILQNLMETFYLGLPVENAYPLEVSDKLKFLLDNRDYRVKLGQQGREYVEKNNNNVELARHVLEIYEDCRK